MDVQNTFNARGSFGIPEAMKKQLEASQQRQAPKPGETAVPKESAPAQTDEAQQKATEGQASAEQASAASAEEQKQKDVDTLRLFWEERLGIQITEKDIRDYIFKGRLIKDGIEAVPGYMRATFQSLNPEELGLVDQRMAEFRETVKFTPDGLTNENALQVLSHGWLKAVEVEDGVAKTAKLLGNTAEDRYKTIQKISALAVQEVIEAWDGFNVLVKIALREKRLLKKR